jgi:inosine/xanthosine triphosphate pyrophosphatase family protein
MKKKVVLGTTNQAKINIVRASLESLPVDILTLNELNIRIRVREDGRSTEENVEKKARAYFAESQLPTLAIDGGLQIAKFPETKQPGVLVRRIWGTARDATDGEVLDYYARELDKVGGESKAIWRGSVVLVVSGEKVFRDTFSFTTVLTSKKRGCTSPGSPLDTMTIEPATGKYFSEMMYQQRPDAKRIFEFVRRHIDEL